MLLVEAVRPGEAGVGPQLEIGRAAVEGVMFGAGEECCAEGRAVVLRHDVEAADLPPGRVDGAGGDHAGTGFGEPERAVLAGVVGGQGAELGGFGVDVEGAVRIVGPAALDEGDEKRGVAVAARSDQCGSDQCSEWQNETMRAQASRRSSSLVA